MQEVTMRDVPEPILPSKASMEAAVRSLQSRNFRLVTALTGGFPGLVKMLLDVPGASRFLLESVTPYAREAFLDFTRSTRENQFCSEGAAVEIALAARSRAHKLMPEGGELLIGLGGTAALATVGKQGPCRWHAMACMVRTSKDVSRVLTPEQSKSWSREVQGRLSDYDALNLLLKVLDLPELEIKFPETAPIVPWEPGFALFPDGRRIPKKELDPGDFILYPGSFRPWHPGHAGAAAFTEGKTGKQVVYCIEVHHPEKEPVDSDEIRSRVVNFAWQAPVMITSGASLYIDKAEMFPGFGFIVGLDMLRKIVDPKYYEGSARLEAALRRFEALGTRFYVFDRSVDGQLMTLDDIDMPEWFRVACCTRMHRHWDISSTQVRAQQAARPA